MVAEQAVSHAVDGVVEDDGGLGGVTNQSFGGPCSVVQQGYKVTASGRHGACKQVVIGIVMLNNSSFVALDFQPKVQYRCTSNIHL